MLAVVAVQQGQALAVALVARVVELVVIQVLTQLQILVAVAAVGGIVEHQVQAVQV
jgi:hypothetical protein